MPDSNLTASGTTSATLSSSPPPSTVPEFRFGTDASVPEWARGKKAEEVLNLTKQLVDNFARYQPSPPPPVPANPTPPAFDPDAYMTGRDLLSAQERVMQQFSAHPDLQAGIELAASGNLGVVRQKYAKEFAKYGPEIQLMLAQVPKKAWTLDNLERVVKNVLVDHLPDLQAEWQTEVQARLEPTMRATGAAGTVPVPDEQSKLNSLESEKIPAEWKLRAQKQGITEATVREFCQLTGQTPEQFYKQFESPRHPIVAEVQVGP